MPYDSDRVLANIQSDITTNLNDTVTSRLGAIAGIDRGTIAGTGSASTNTATVTAVNTGRSVLNYLGGKTSSAVENRQFGYITLTNSTTITAQWGITAAGTDIVSYELVEYAA